MRRAGVRLVLAALASGATITSAAAQARRDGPAATVRIALHPEIDRPTTRFEGWGTALAWFANVTGGWPDADRQHLADLLYGPKGLGWTIARYNIGGGAAPDAKALSQPGANVAGFWHEPDASTGRDWWRPDDPAMWDWSQDANQRWWLDAVKQRVAKPIFEAFSNSPPWFMTVSGEVSGARKATDDNLRPGFERRFADYLTRVVAELERRQHIHFRTLSPVNEPDTDYWYAGNRQEGAHWSPARQAMMIEATAASIEARGLDTAVAAPDETSSQLFVTDWAGFPPAARAKIGQLNVHSYGTVHQSAVRDIARAADIRLWMSENDHPMPDDPENFEGMTSPLAFAEHVVLDLKRLRPSAWVFWQAVENVSAVDGAGGSNWGLIKTDLRASADVPHPIHVTRKYWAMAQFSRYIRPGFRLVAVDDVDTAGALSPDGNELVLVHVNGGLVARALALPKGWTARMVLTDATHDAACVDGTTVPPRAIATLILRRGDAGGEPCASYR
ncbi:glycoside hydrolase [Hephaestia mangrovi]|uniref:glycoside hydrolase n=1 Tax=Hephaestia mangrovi TaxID=2873268 RepID=UPI0034E2E09C